jgi:fatty-acyl-CoA synthase
MVNATLPADPPADLPGRLRAVAQRRGTRTAIVCGERRIGWDALGVQIARWAARFDEVPGPLPVVLLFVPQGIEAIACFFGAMAAGAVPSFMPLPSAKQDPQRWWETHRTLFERIAPAAVVAPRAQLAAIAALAGAAPLRLLAIEDAPGDGAPEAPPRPPAPVALLQHSSGTTGLKKGVALGHAAIAAQVDGYAAVLGAGADDTVVSWLPLYHDMGLVACTLLPLLLGQTLVLLDPFDWSAEPARLFDAITEHRAQWVWLPNFAFEHLRRTVPADPARHDLASVRAFIDCSEPCRPATFDRFVQAFATLGVRAEQLQVCWAMAETVFAVTQTPPGRPVRRLRVRAEALARQVLEPAADGDTELLSCGPLLPGCTVRVDPPGAAVGELVVSAPFLFDGYHGQPERSAEVLAGGAYRSRDLGFVHEGEVYVLGRLDDLLICNGRNHLAHEVEQVAGQVDGVKAGRGVAVGLPSDERGTDDIWLVQERSGAPDAEGDRRLRRAVREAVLAETGLLLHDVLLVEPGWLVKTTSGKISRAANRAKLVAELAARLAARRGARPQPAPATEPSR